MKIIIFILLNIAIITGQFKLIAEASLENKTFLRFISDICKIDNNIYALDYLDPKIVKYDTKLNELKVYDKKGKGPGEFDNVYLSSMTVHNGNIYVMAAFNKIMQFDSDLNYINTVRLNEIGIFEIKSDKHYIYLNYNVGIDNPEIIRYNLKFEKLSSIYNEKLNKEREGRSTILTLHNDKIYLFYDYSNICKVYSLGGKKINEFKLKNLPKPKSTTDKDSRVVFGKTVSLPGRPLIRKAFIKNNRIIIANTTNEVFHYDFNGNQIKHYIIEKNNKHKYELLYIDDENNYYLSEISESRIKIIRWE